MPALSEFQTAAYDRDGYLFPIDVISEKEARDLRTKFETAEASTAANEKLRGDTLRSSPHFVLPFLDELTRHPSIVEPVASILGGDLLVWDTTFFIKEPQTTNFVGWHQDLHYWGLDDEDEVTAWVALSPATVESGCMRFVPGSHRQIVSHIDHNNDDAMLSRGQELAVDVDEAEAVSVELAPGQASLHHGRTFHASHPNRSDDRRIGLAVRYIKPSMKWDSVEKGIVTLVRGSDRQGNFELFAGPRGQFTDEGMAIRERSIALTNAVNYRDYTGNKAQAF